MKHKSLFVFDIETIPDLAAAANLIGSDFVGTEENSIALRDSLVNYHLEITQGKNSFFRQPFHQVVTISFLEAEIEYIDGFEFYRLKDLRSGGNIASQEKELVTGFFHHLKKIFPRLVSFNGKTFDLPVLKYRAMLYNVQLDWLYKAGDKWNSYNSKYSLDWHCDLLDAFSDFGVSARVKMNEVCAMLGLPGKMDIEGDMVEQLYYENKIQDIRNYCELDVLNTYILYLRYAFHTGKMNKIGYANALSGLIKLLHESNAAHYQQFLEKWFAKAREEDFDCGALY